MKKLITILLVLMTGLSYGQAWQWPSMNLYRADQQLQVRNNIMYAVNRGTDSLGKLLRVEMKAQYDASLKALRDSMASLIPPDNKTIVVVNGKFTAVGGGTVNLAPVYDSIAKLGAKLNTSNLILANSIDDVAKRVTSLEAKVATLENWKGAVTAQLVTINGAIATIPKTATSTSVSTTQTTTTTTLQ